MRDPTASSLTWGWRARSAFGLAGSPPPQRVATDLDLRAEGELQLTGSAGHADAGLPEPAPTGRRQSRGEVECVGSGRQYPGGLRQLAAR